MKSKSYLRTLIQKGFILLITICGIYSTTIAEGSKEVYVGNYETHFFFCSDSITHCNNGGDRSSFATYECDSLDRLCFNINSTDEVVYLGFNPDFGWGDVAGVYRIKDINGNIVKSEEIVPSSGTGFINSIDEARTGPIQVAGSNGYDAIVFTPPAIGYYYIEFNRVLASSPTTSSPGAFELDLLDITIENSVTSTVEEGRLYSHAWQLYETNHCNASFFIYSDDSLTTSLEMNDLDGGIWVMYANQYGCDSTGDFSQDRKSNFYNSDPILQYRVFLNEPDANIFPAATTLGSIIPPITTQTDCDGTVDFTVVVSNYGNIELLLDFPPPYETRLIMATVVAGSNIIEWDGLDGNPAGGVPVPNDISIAYVCSFINGLCNFPLYDVEDNSNGFNIDIVSPTGTTPLTYWDDSNIPGGTTNLAGCSGSGCHPWPDGNYYLMNTWSYSASTTTSPVMFVHQRNPDSLIFLQQPPQYYSPGNTSVSFSVIADPNTDTYYWNYTGSDVTINQANAGDNFITLDFGPSATSGDLEVYGTNSNCPNPGPTSVLPITVGPPPAITADFSGTPTSGETPLLVNFTDLSTGSVDSWTWGFGDGNTSIVQNPSNTYAGIGTYSVSLTVTNTNGSDTETKTDYITVTAPVITPEFTANVTSGDAPLIVTFSDQSIGSNISWLWDFGDGNTSTNQSPVHTYSNPGTYTVSLTITDPYSSQTEVKTDYITALTPAITPEFEGTPTSGNIPFDVAFTDLSIGSNISWLWDFGDGTTSIDQNPTHTYSDTNSYTVSLTISDAYSSETETKTDYIIANPPILYSDFVGNPVSGDYPLEVTFTDISVGNADTWLWDFGDGDTSTDQNPVHTYMDEGVYTVSLTITDQYGSDTEIKTDYITVAAIVANFEANPTTGNLPLDVTFTDLSTGEIDSWEWDFGDGNTSSFQLPVHTYMESGNYNVSLTVTGTAGSNTLVMEDYIYVTVPAPVAEFSATPTFGEAPLLVTFSDLSTGDIDTWDWEFGDGESSNEQNPSHEYQTPGNFTISLTVIGEGGDSKMTKEDYILIPVGLEEDSEEVILIYPNPVSEKLTVVFADSKSRKIKLIAIDGTIVIDKLVFNKEISIDIRNIISGVYTLIIDDSLTSSSVKIIKK